MKSRYGLEIRTAGSADAAGLCDLLQTAGQVVPPRLMAERLDGIRQEAGAVLIAAEWGPPSGLVAVHWYHTLDADQATAQITTLFVAPENRRRGIGRLLLKSAAQSARVAGCGTLELLASAEEPLLHDFCRATGFVETGTRFLRPLRKK